MLHPCRCRQRYHAAQRSPPPLCRAGV